MTKIIFLALWYSEMIKIWCYMIKAGYRYTYINTHVHIYILYTHTCINTVQCQQWKEVYMWCEIGKLCFMSELKIKHRCFLFSLKETLSTLFPQRSFASKWLIWKIGWNLRNESKVILYWGKTQSGKRPLSSLYLYIFNYKSHDLIITNI